MDSLNQVKRKQELAWGHAADELAGGAERVESLVTQLQRSSSRRDLLRAGAFSIAAGILAPFASFFAGTMYSGEARADQAVKTGKFIFPRLKFSVRDETKDIWNTGPSGDAILRKNLRELTNINASDEPKVVKLAEFEDLCQYPFVFMTSEGYFKLPDNEEKNLREFLERGGFVHADDCVHPASKGHIFKTHMADGVFRDHPQGSQIEGDRFFMDYCRMINRLFPDNPVRRVPPDHEIFHCYYDFAKGSPHLQGVDHGIFGLFEPGTGRLMTIASPGDLHCGWMCEYFGKKQDMEAIKMGINILIYFLSH